MVNLIASTTTTKGLRVRAALDTDECPTGVKVDDATMASLHLIAEEVIAHLSGLVGADVMVTLELHAAFPSGAPDNVVRTVTENCVTLKFADHGFEKE